MKNSKVYKLIVRNFGGKATSYMRYAPKEVAKDFGIDYIDVDFKTKNFLPQEEDRENDFLLEQGKYLLFYPPNDGSVTSPFNFYSDFGGRYEKVLDNQSAFLQITNLSEILLQMTELYLDTIDRYIFLDPMCFAIRLDDPITSDYHGAGKLVMTKNTLCNRNVLPDDIIAAREEFFNEFLDHFIGWNFGVAVDSCGELKNELSRLAIDLRNRGLRKEARPGIDVFITDSVQHVRYGHDGNIKIISCSNCFN